MSSNVVVVVVKGVSTRLLSFAFCSCFVRSKAAATSTLRSHLRSNVYTTRIGKNLVSLNYTIHNTIAVVYCVLLRIMYRLKACHCVWLALLMNKFFFCATSKPCRRHNVTSFPKPHTKRLNFCESKIHTRATIVKRIMLLSNIKQIERRKYDQLGGLKGLFPLQSNAFSSSSSLL